MHHEMIWNDKMICLGLEHHNFLIPRISHHVSGLLATPCGEGNLKLAKFLIEDCGATLRRDRFGLLPIHDAATRLEMVACWHRSTQVDGWIKWMGVSPYSDETMDSCHTYVNQNPYSLRVILLNSQIPDCYAQDSMRFKTVTMKYDDTCKAGSSQPLSASSENMWHQRLLWLWLQSQKSRIQKWKIVKLLKPSLKLTAKAPEKWMVGPD